MLEQYILPSSRLCSNNIIYSSSLSRRYHYSKHLSITTFVHATPLSPRQTFYHSIQPIPLFVKNEIPGAGVAHFFSAKAFFEGGDAGPFFIFVTNAPKIKNCASLTLCF